MTQRDSDKTRISELTNYCAKLELEFKNLVNANVSLEKQTRCAENLNFD